MLERLMRLFATLRASLTPFVALPWPYRLVRFGLATLFIYGGAVKLLDPKAFARTLSGYDLVPDALLPVVSVGLPLLETLAGSALLLDIRGSLAVIAGLMGLFIAVLAYGLLQGLDVDCGCFGADDLARQANLQAAFYRDLALGGLVVPYLYLARRARARQKGLHRRGRGGGGANEGPSVTRTPDPSR